MFRSLCFLAVVLTPALSLAGGAPRALGPVGAIPLEGELKAWTGCPSGSLLAVALSDRVIVGRLDFAGRRLATLATLPVRAYAMSFSGDCGLLAISESSEGSPETRVNGASLWRVAGGKVTRFASLGTYRYPVSSLSLSQDGGWAAVAVNTGELTIYRIGPAGATRTDAAPVLPKGDQYLRVRLSRGRLLAGAYRGAVQLFNLDPATGKLGPPVDLMAPTTATRKTGSLDTNTGDIVMPGGARVFAVDFSADGRRAFAAVESGQVFAWDLGPAPGPRVTLIDGFDGPNAMALSPDGAGLALTGNTSAQLWHLQRGRASPRASLDKIDHIDKYVITRGLGYLKAGQLVVGTGADRSRLLLFAP